MIPKLPVTARLYTLRTSTDAPVSSSHLNQHDNIDFKDSLVFRHPPTSSSVHGTANKLRIGTVNCCTKRTNTGRDLEMGVKPIVSTNPTVLCIGHKNHKPGHRGMKKAMCVVLM